MKIREIISYINSFAPLESAMDFDNVGLLVGSPDDEITAAAVALDITPEVISEAKERGAQLIISHHPVIFQPIKAIDRGDVVYKLIENHIDALCMHTNLDLSPEFGVNTCLAEAVGVKNAAFVEDECLYVGELEEELSAREFAEIVKEKLGCDGLRFTLGDKRVKKIAICSGSGGDYAPLAKSSGADLLLTGEIKHHEILDANALNIAVIDAGHFRTEDIVIAPLCKRLSEKFPEIRFFRSEKCFDRIEFL